MTRSLPLLVCLLWAPGALASEFEGEGYAEVVDGNIVSARARALREGRRQAFSQALRRMLRIAPGGELPAVVKRWALQREADYLRSYRVLTEEQTEAYVRIRVSLSLDAGDLRDQLRRLQMSSAADADASVAPTGQLVALWVRSAELERLAESGNPSDRLGVQATEYVRGALEDAQLALKSVRADTQEAALGVAQAHRCTWLFTLQVSARQVAGVRGLAWDGARVELELTALQIFGPSRAAAGPGGALSAHRPTRAWRGSAVVAARSFAGALDGALQRAFELPLQALRRALVQRMNPAAKGMSAGLHQLGFRGLDSLAQQRELCRKMRAHSARVGACTLLRFDRGAVVVGLRRAPAPRALLRLVRRAAREMGLQAHPVREEGGATTVRLSALPLPTTEL
jgi:hypothetical protein